MSILFVVHQNFSHSINCVFFFFPASRRNLSLSQTPPVSFCSRLLFFILHRLFTSCSQQQLFHNGIMVEVYLLLCSVVEEQYFFFFSFSRDLAVWICIMSWLNWKGIDARLMCVHVLWRDEQMWCQFTRPFCWMVVKKKKCSLKNRPSEDLLRWCNSCSGLEDRVAGFLSWTSWPLNRSVHLSCNIPSQMKSSSLSTVWSPTAQL